MVMRMCGVCLSFCLGSCAGAEPIDEHIWELISSEITHRILEQTSMIFGSVKEGIIQTLDERLGIFRIEIMAIMGVRTVSFSEFLALGAPEFFGEKHLIASRN